ncbi:MAG: hypothetical protein GY753_01845, partial [Gammaproteobacteria bacterium]|nr:hypothetical protein [Gammaproteobacteria bacterium]
VVTTGSTIASYYEPKFRVTGLNVVESKDIEVGLFGTSAPDISENEWDEDKVMVQLMSAGLAGSYLNSSSLELSEIQANFSDEAAQAPYTATYGITPTLVHTTMSTYSHRDEAFAAVNDGLNEQFLDTNYITCTVASMQTITPTLATTIQETQSIVDLSMLKALDSIENDDSTVDTSEPVHFDVPLELVNTVTWRQAQLSSYSCDSDGSGGAAWSLLSNIEA